MKGKKYKQIVLYRIFLLFKYSAILLTSYIFYRKFLFVIPQIISHEGIKLETNTRLMLDNRMTNQFHFSYPWKHSIQKKLKMLFF